MGEQINLKLEPLTFHSQYRYKENNQNSHDTLNWKNPTKRHQGIHTLVR